MSLSKGALGPEAAVGAQTALEGALEDLRVKYEKKAEVERKAAARAADEAAESAPAPPPEDDDADWLDDPELDKIREARIQQLKEAAAKAKEVYPLGHGEYTEIVEEEFLKEVTGSENVVCQFYHNDFSRCKIMDMHLRKLAHKFPKTKFIKLNAEKAPFFVNKLAVRVLPTVVMFKGGIAKDRLLGFERLGSDEFKTKALERELRGAGVIEAPKTEDDSSSEDEDVERRDGATLAEALEARRKRITVSAYGRGEDDE